MPRELPTQPNVPVRGLPEVINKRLEAIRARGGDVEGELIDIRDDLRQRRVEAEESFVRRRARMRAMAEEIREGVRNGTITRDQARQRLGEAFREIKFENLGGEQFKKFALAQRALTGEPVRLPEPEAPPQPNIIEKAREAVQMGLVDAKDVAKRIGEMALENVPGVPKAENRFERSGLGSLPRLETSSITPPVKINDLPEQPQDPLGKPIF